MQNLVNTYLDKFKKERRDRHRLTCILLALALVISTGVSWQMRLTGVAATNETFCGLEEHTHTEDCYETVLVCSQEEGEDHTHTEECYEEQLVCGLEEHTHTVECLTDETADVETADDWEATLPTLTGVWAEDVVSVAKSQLGYTESTANFTLDDDGVTRRGYTRYGAWAGNKYGNWDAMFVSFCLHYAGISKSDFPEATGAYAWSVTLKDKGLYESAEDYIPVPGDLVFFDTDNNGKIDSVGIVSEVNEENGRLTVIEGDYETDDGTDAVVKNTYSITSGTISGYGALPKQASGEENTILSAATDDEDENSDEAENSDDENSDENQTTKSLEDYIASINETEGHTASITLNLRTESDTDISGDDDSKVVTTNTKYHLTLTVYSSAGFEANTTYTYSLPEDVVVEAATGSIAVGDGTVIGTWTISEDGTVTLAFNDNAGGYQDMEVTFTATATVNTTEETITIGGTTYTVSETTNLAVNKSGNYSGYTKVNNYYRGRTWEIEFSQSGVSLADTKVTDYATDTQYSLLNPSATNDPSYNNQHFDTSIPLVITIVDASGNTVYTWTVEWSDSSLTMYTLDDDGNVVETTSTSDRIIGWQYTFPDTVSATNASGDAEELDLNTADMSPYEIHINSQTIYDVVPSTDDARITYYNRVEVDNGVEKGTDYAGTDQTTGTYALVKDWSRGDDGVSVDWAVGVTIPGGLAASYELVDIMYVDTMATGNYLVFADYTTNYAMTITISEDTTINGIEIEAGTYTIYDISGEVPDDALFVYSYAPNSSGLTAYMVLGMVCHCDEDCCDGWEDGECTNILYTSASGTTYCTCWQLDQSAKITLTYTTPEEDMLELLSAYGYSEKVVKNYAALRTGNYNGTDPLTSSSILTSDSEYVGLALTAKTLSEAPTNENNYTASYEVAINTDHYRLTKDGVDLTIADTLSSSLTFLPGSLVIQATDEEGETKTLSSDDYTYTYDSDTHVIAITIKNPGTNSYTITYDAQMLNPSSGATYSNSLTLSWQGEDITVETDTSYLSEVTTSGATYMVTILKTDETTEAPLEGAEFKLCNADGTVKATGTTDENGQVTFSTTSGTGEDSLSFATHTLYYLEETDAPEGYTLDSTKHYFYFCDYTDDGTCEECSSMDLPDDATKLLYGGVINITNAQTTYGFTIQKVDAEKNEDGSYKTLTGAEFYLYYESAVLDDEGNPTEEMCQYYAILGEDNAVTSWNSSTDQATKLVVGEDGTVSISGLPAGTYYLEEVTAPDGYNLLSDPIKVTVASDGTIDEDSASASVSTDDVVTLIVENTSGYELPASGGSGTWMYGLSGLILCGGALLVLYRRKSSF